MSGLKRRLGSLKKVFGSSDSISSSGSNEHQPQSKSMRTLLNSTLFRKWKDNFKSGNQNGLAIQSAMSTRENNLIPLATPNPKDGISTTPVAATKSSSTVDVRGVQTLGEIKEEEGVGKQGTNPTKQVGRGHKSIVHMGLRIKQEFKENPEMARRAKFMSTGNLEINEKETREFGSLNHLKFQSPPPYSSAENLPEESMMEDIENQLGVQSERFVKSTATDSVNAQETSFFGSTSKENLNFLGQPNAPVVLATNTKPPSVKNKPIPKARFSKCYEWVDKQSNSTFLSSKNISNDANIIFSGNDIYSEANSIATCKPVPKPRSDKITC